MIAVVMAGGEGLRLRPLTLTCPKPMLNVGGVPVLETLVRQLTMSGVDTIWIVVRHLKEQIIDAAPAWSKAYDVGIGFIIEPYPYGTAGGLSLIPHELRPTVPFLVVNADILSQFDFKALREYHVAHGYALTLVGRDHTYRLPYGYPVLSESPPGDVIGFREKPSFTYRVNSGIYCLDPDLVTALPPGPAEMPELIRWASARRDVGMYPLDAPYHEIGSLESYAAAESFYERWMR